MLRCISIPNIAEISKGQLLVVKWLKKNCCHENIQLCYSFPKIWTRMHRCLASDVIEGKGCVFGHESYLIVIRNCGVRMLRWVVLLVFCCVMIIGEDICWKIVEIAMFGWVKHTHSVLGFLWWCSVMLAHLPWQIKNFLSYCSRVISIYIKSV